jgi:hypothetical protein
MFHMTKNVSESLAGRVGIVNLFGLSNSEIAGTLFDSFTTDKEILIKRLERARPMTLPEVFERIHLGGMPRVYEQQGLDLTEYYSSYVQTYLSRDVRDLTQVADELAFYCLTVRRYYTTGRTPPLSFLDFLADFSAQFENVSLALNTRLFPFPFHRFGEILHSINSGVHHDNPIVFVNQSHTVTSPQLQFLPDVNRQSYLSLGHYFSCIE